ncbi:protein LEAD-SENSITIVE 1-like isoform X1 [Ziziphus jujuba]|uniref:Protein LEAD-SENSITIVE 1-like isoform X1 n=1 Tax=Ziziphus jujuba TaxID=326968 RepID=A0ABM4A6P0_ZIZJJ|nr:protein LEAD-SENSITIVE 1-like isoform X1 [Ziziphus jujuba]XP_060672373.1 protein LEAD-SENSITIVE 1-like isoform X1 [Ziziphus jujuba]XP_060672374.1 protein LEAD-SENSITIVE 1-like isoform X1 [Ziziphus jujuba]XP_060672375.1 protein LEAD-SENSITIVE 1-like isoform X1 [Ziziphus jujuba]XP_060672376.1 protein LEAD-SENSITIVE 1-like isoform X1 [Ziziphus jujuba]XP_060672377.1 protein LEAD-SENSITIVE 1-like isoform X1 [Ziziphus jujuba]XP_060672378.1 protein LEAD-SENSITIVE 1-like isoform X1 [Ziziphus jujub
MKKLRIRKTKQLKRIKDHACHTWKRNYTYSNLDDLHLDLLLLFLTCSMICSMLGLNLVNDMIRSLISSKIQREQATWRRNYSYAHRGVLILCLCLLLLFLLGCLMLALHLRYKMKEVKYMIQRVVSNKIQRNQLISGDHIYTWRRGHAYAHHVTAGIYVGKGKVIHLIRGAGHILGSSSRSHPSDNPGRTSGDQSTHDHVISSSVDKFLSGGDLYLCEYSVSLPFFLIKTRGGTCTLAPSDPREDVLHRATYLLKKGFGVYNLSENNCEYFAIYCKTGLLVDDNNCVRRSIGRSGQAASLLAAIVVTISSLLRFSTASPTWLAAVGYGMYCIFRLASDIRVRRNVCKVEGIGHCT